MTEPDIQKALQLLNGLRRKHRTVSLPSGQHGDRRELCDMSKPEQQMIMRVFPDPECVLCLCGAADGNLRIDEIVELIKKDRP